MGAWKERRNSIDRMIEVYQRERDALDALGEMEGIASIDTNGYGDTISITPVDTIPSRDMALSIIARLRARGQAPPMATKTLDSATGKITYHVPGPMKGWILYVSGGDPRCKVVPVTKTRTVPAKPAVAAIEAHEEEYVAYEIENPEECGAS